MNPWQYPQSTGIFYSPVSSHYAQAYLHNSLRGFPQQTPAQTAPSTSTSASTFQPRPRPKGTHGCTYDQCTFSGSQKAVEIHMMDRHLIYPPNYNKSKQRNWDADPSLKGKPIIIQGTNVTLNTPEDIEAWIAERKKRFPTASHVADKKAKLEEAIARGQLPFGDNPRFPKRARFEEPSFGTNRGPGRGRGRRGKNGPPCVRHGVVNMKPSMTPVRTAPDSSSLQPSLPAQPPASALPEDYGSSDSDDVPPETLSTKTTKNTVPEPLPLPETSRDSGNAHLKPSMNDRLTVSRKPVARQPRGPPPIPFGQNTSLLRNLLLPEIRNTVSNLSQAIRFLVDNDFLENVELKPGDAERQKNRIQVLSSTEDPLMSQSSLSS